MGDGQGHLTAVLCPCQAKTVLPNLEALWPRSSDWESTGGAIDNA